MPMATPSNVQPEARSRTVSTQPHQGLPPALWTVLPYVLQVDADDVEAALLKLAPFVVGQVEVEEPANTVVPEDLEVLGHGVAALPNALGDAVHGSDEGHHVRSLAQEPG